MTRQAGRTDPDWACSDGGPGVFAGQLRANNRDKGNIALFQINDSARFVMYELGIPIFPCEFLLLSRRAYGERGGSGTSVLRRNEALFVHCRGRLARWQ